MADKRKEYTVDINGLEHTMLLEPEDAKSLYGEKAVESKSRTPQNKAASAENK